MACQLDLGSKSDKLVAQYARALISGKYNSLLKRIKFERFLWRLGRAVGKMKVDELLYDLYTCSDNQYGPNHSAISYLLQKRVCLFCITTNFDNCIEKSYPERNLSIRDQKDKVSEPPKKHDSPLLLKLHGDAASKTCVATSPELSAAKLKGDFAYLEELLKGKRILVVGYSGVGDVDIAPHLRSIDAQLFWCNHLVKPFPQIHPKQSNVLCDLALRLDGSHVLSAPRNLLLELAQAHGWKDVWNGSDHQWENGIRDWVKPLSNNVLREFVVSLLSWVSSWPHVHIAYYRRKQEGDIESTQHDVAQSFTQIAAYKSAEKSLSSLMSQAELSNKTEREARQMLGFIRWREGKFQLALETLKPLLPRSVALSSNELSEFADHARVYLETLGEMMQYQIKLERRIMLYRDAEAENAAQVLRSLQGTNNDNYLARLAIFDTDYAIGRTIKPSTIQELFEECYDMEEWASASLAVQLLIKLSYWNGLKATFRVTPKLLQRRNLKLILKNYAMVIHCSFGRQFPVILRLLNGRLLMRFFTNYLEFQYTQKQKEWDLEWDSNLFRVE